MANFPVFWRNDQQNPFRAMSRLQRQMDRYFEDLMGGNWTAELPAIEGIARPALDMEETPSHYVLSFDLPGLKKDDVHIEFANGILRVWGERKEEREKEKSGAYRSERFYGTFERSIAIPSEVKGAEIEAQFENGVLHVAIPKAEAAKPKEIPIAEGKSGFFQKLLGKKNEEKPSKERAA